MEESRPRKGHISLEACNLIATIFSGLLISGLLGYCGLRLEQQLGLQKNASEYINILANQEAPEYVKGLALSSLLRFELVEPALIFSAAYKHEDLNGIGILKDIVDEFGANHDPIDVPIGHVDILLRGASGTLLVEGWAIDNKSKNLSFQAWLDGKQMNDFTIRSRERKDIRERFKRYDLPRLPGFILTINHVKITDGKHHLRVRIKDEDELWMEIFNTNIYISKDLVFRSSDPPNFTHPKKP